MSLTGVWGDQEVVVWFTESTITGPIFRLSVCRLTGNDKSRMIRGRRLAWGTAATGDTFKFAGGFFISSDARMTSQNPPFT